MGFLHPLALLGLAAAGVPALLHLLQRREPPTVPFPAVRYLEEAEQRHSRRLKLRHLVLLVLRTVLIVALVLAAARPVLPLPSGAAHAPTAVVLILDNSLSSAAIVAGRRVLDRLVDEAGAVVGALGTGDRLWLLLSDGIPRAMDAAEATALLPRVHPTAVRLDLTEAVRTAATVLAGQSLPGEIVVLSDLQASALSPADPVDARVLLLAPGPAPGNRAVEAVRGEPAVWSPGGRVAVFVGGGNAPPGEVTLELDGRTLARDLGGPGDQVTFPVRELTPGWHMLHVTLQPDELRMDDSARLAVRAAPAAAVRAATGAGRFVEQALSVLESGGRVRPGRGVEITDRPGPGRTILVPPADPAEIGAVNRALAARGGRVRFGEVVEGEWLLSGDPAELRGARVWRRHRLDGEGVVLARAGVDAWLMRDGDHVVLASRLDERWTDLPVSAAFVPVLDALVNRVVAAEVWHVAAAPGAVVTVPPAVSGVDLPGGRVAVSGDRRLTVPLTPGSYYLTGTAGDTIGALSVHPDPRESILRRAEPAAVRRAFGPRAEIRESVAGHVFSSTRRGEVSTGLLVLALGLAIAELAVASTGGGRARRGS